MNKRRLAVVTILVVVAGWLAATAAFGTSAPHIKVTICHATASETNPYVSITVNINSIGDAQSVSGHGDHEGDIIPPFVYEDFSYPGQGDQSLLPECGETTDTTTSTTTADTTTTSTTEVTTTTVAPTTSTTAPPTTTTTVAPPVHVCQEDEACWDCKTMGNHVCVAPPVTIRAPQPALPHTL